MTGMMDGRPPYQQRPGGHPHMRKDVGSVPTAYAQAVATSMTIEEMRELHRRAEAEAESKRTELRLVLASRYRELVGSSDEVQHMQKRAKELDDLVRALPGLMDRMIVGALSGPQNAEIVTEEKDSGDSGDKNQNEETDLAAVRSRLSQLPRFVHRALDRGDVHVAATTLIELFSLIASRTDAFALATVLSSKGAATNTPVEGVPPVLQCQMKMVYLHVQTLPSRTIRMAKKSLVRSASRLISGDKKGSAEPSARALSTIDLLDIHRSKKAAAQRAAALIDLYYDSKSTLIRGLLDRLTTSGNASTPAQTDHAAASPAQGRSPSDNEGGDGTTAPTADSTVATEDVLSKIVLILQYDCLLHAYQMFVLRKFDGNGGRKEAETQIMSSLPSFDPDVLRAKASHFLAAHLPLIRTKVKAVLMSVAGTTASRLGQIRQSLYDKTDGADCIQALDSNGLCSWDEAVAGIVDVRIVSVGTTTSSSSESEIGVVPNSSQHQQHGSSRRFSLWSALFSNTFSSLVHSILTTSFHSVHARVVSTLRASLAGAPPLAAVLPHEAHRNTLRIATDLDASLKRVSDDAHELLVHAEEREESERRLRQSLYVQTCEIMGRLLGELRRMLSSSGYMGQVSERNETDDTKRDEDATKEFIVGRLCHLLKFRLTTLPTLLDPKSSPAAIGMMTSSGRGGRSGSMVPRSPSSSGGAKGGMITVSELRSAFEIADDDDDGLISFDEAMEAMESAFSGTPFQGADMVRDTLLLISSSGAGDGAEAEAGNPTLPSGTSGVGGGLQVSRNVTLSELALLSARGLRHASTGPESALGTVQSSLDDLVSTCISKWAKAALAPSLRAFCTRWINSVEAARSVSKEEWTRLHPIGEDDEIAASASSTCPLCNVSAHVTAYLLDLAATFNRSVCPSDSLPSVPSLDYAAAMGVSFSSSRGIQGIANTFDTLRVALLQQAARSLAVTILDETLATDGSDGENGLIPSFRGASLESLIQIYTDIEFVDSCIVQRCRDELERFPRATRLLTAALIKEISGRAAVELEEAQQDDPVHTAAEVLNAMSCRVSATMGRSFTLDLKKQISSKTELAAEPTKLLLVTLFDPSTSSTSSLLSPSAFHVGAASSTGGTSATAMAPLQSSRRFDLLPVQAERSLNELQLRSKLGKDKSSASAESEGSGSGAGGLLGVGTGFVSLFKGSFR